MSDPPYPPIIEGAYGLTCFSAWFVVLREDWDFIQEALNRRAPYTKRSFQVVLTLNHEAVHFIQGLTTAAAYSYSYNLIVLSAQLQGSARRGTLTPDELRRYRAIYRSQREFLQRDVRGVSTLDLLEGVAAIEAFRATAVELSAEALWEHLRAFFPDPKSPYRVLSGIVGDYFGHEEVLALAPRIAYLALNADDPPRWFWNIMDALSHLCVSPPKFDSTALLARFMDFDLARGLVGLHRRGALREVHPLLKPYLDYLAGLGSDEDVCEIASVPGAYLRSQTEGAAASLLPPLVLASGGRGKSLGLAAEWSKDQLFRYLDTAALVGASERLLADERPYQCCPHRECLIHETGLCHQWYTVPQTIPWSQCAFPTRLRVHFQKSAEELMQLRAEAMKTPG